MPTHAAGDALGILQVPLLLVLLLSEDVLLALASNFSSVPDLKERRLLQG